jgi:hypothetical protein
MSELLKRPPEELARDLRMRALLLTGEKWELEATVAIMRLAADMIDELRRRYPAATSPQERG